MCWIWTVEGNVEMIRRTESILRNIIVDSCFYLVLMANVVNITS